MSTDRIEKKTLLKAPLVRVWQALTDSREFGHWFGARMEGPFEPGRSVRARSVPTAVDAEVAKMQEPWEGIEFDIAVERIEPMRLFSFRWQPGGEPGDADPMTLVTFTLEEVPGGTLLTVVESGFDALPPERRAKAFADNEGGWEMQMRLVALHLAQD